MAVKPKMDCDKSEGTVLIACISMHAIGNASPSKMLCSWAGFSRGEAYVNPVFGFELV
jgi:hypothetical protein